jgi:hypothetical protein
VNRQQNAFLFGYREDGSQEIVVGLPHAILRDDDVVG